jgi:uncharacterized protein (TIGR04222 family)
MNVFDLPGPEFLVFYITFAGGIGALTWFALSFVGGGGAAAPGPALLADPYEIACMRRGLAEVGRLAIVSLAERGLLDLPKPGVIAPDTAKRTPRGLHPVEQALLVNCPRPTGRVAAVIGDSRVKAACLDVRERLIQMGLAPSSDAKAIRAFVAIFAGLLVAGVGIAKIQIAFDRGRGNVGILIFCIIAVVIFFLFIAAPRPRTRAGTRMLEDLKRLLDVRRGGPQHGAPQDEALLLGAVFGAAGLAGYSDLQSVYTRASPAQSGGSSCGSSSSCSSSSCGGGGGGCGGCGSS